MAEITYWGKLADVTGVQEERRALPAHVNDTDALRTWIDAEHTAGGVFLDNANRIALNDEIVAEPASVRDVDTIGFLPPVSGG